MTDKTKYSGIDTRMNEKKEVMNVTKEQLGVFADVISHSLLSALKEHASTAKVSHDSSSFKMPELGVTGKHLQSGLDILHAPRSGKQEATAGVTSKHSRYERR